MSTFRVATLNVHSFQTSSFYGTNISDLISILEPLNLDLIAVQEIQNNNKWNHFSSRLSLQYSLYGECNRGYFGNGIASRHPIVSFFHAVYTSWVAEIRWFPEFNICCNTSRSSR